MRQLIVLCLLAVAATVQAQIAARSDTYIQQDAGIDVTQILAIPRSGNIAGLSGYQGAPVYFESPTGRLYAHNGTSWVLIGGTGYNVPENRSITAGDGLTGGGDLSANRTLAVDNTVLRTTGNQSKSGTMTFTSPVVVPNATAGNHAVNLGQLNALVNNGRLAQGYRLFGQSVSRSGTPASGVWIPIAPDIYDLDNGSLITGATGTFLFMGNTFINNRDMLNIKGRAILIRPGVTRIAVRNRVTGALLYSSNIYGESSDETRHVSFDVTLTYNSANSLRISWDVLYQNNHYVGFGSFAYTPDHLNLGYVLNIETDFRGAGTNRQLYTVSDIVTTFYPSYQIQ